MAVGRRTLLQCPSYANRRAHRASCSTAQSLHDARDLEGRSTIRRPASKDNSTKWHPLHNGAPRMGICQAKCGWGSHRGAQSRPKSHGGLTSGQRVIQEASMPSVTLRPLLANPLPQPRNEPISKC
jgi:hypothetical protein